MMLSPLSFQFAHDAFADAVGGDRDAALLHGFGSGAADVAVDLVGPGQLAHAAGFESANDVGVVDDLADAVDRALRGVASASMICTARRTPMQNPISVARMISTIGVPSPFRIQYRCRGIAGR